MARAAGSTSEHTRERLLGAALVTLRTEGIVGTSARAVARTADVNQALIYYHFGSIHELLLAACRELSERRVAAYRDRLERVETLPELVTIARELHAQDIADGNVVVLTQLLAGIGGDDELGPRILEIFGPWIEVVEIAVRRVLTGTPFEELLAVEELSYAIAAMFLGIGLLTHLGDDRARDGRMFDALDRLADIGDEMIGAPPIAINTLRRRLARRPR